jgi:hypothetical protein
LTQAIYDILQRRVGLRICDAEASKKPKPKAVFYEGLELAIQYDIDETLELLNIMNF